MLHRYSVIIALSEGAVWGTGSVPSMIQETIFFFSCTVNNSER
jgi:hypothetical protein